MIQEKALCKIVTEALSDADGGELFMEKTCTESLAFKDDTIASNSFCYSGGFALRAFYNDKTVFVNSSDVNEKNIKKAADFIRNNKLSEKSLNFTLQQKDKRQKSLYVQQSPIAEDGFCFAEKIAFLKKVYDYTLLQSQNIKKVTVTLSGSFQEIEIIKQDGAIAKDSRPLCRFGVSVVATDGKNFEIGNAGKGGRFLYSVLVKGWKDVVETAVRQAETNLKAVPSPAGQMTVVLGSGWPGIILHEAIGHGLEADFNRKKTSVFSDLLGKRVASDIVTVVDDGAIQDRRGSINIDDEGTQSAYNVLIKNGHLVSYMHDLMSAKVMKTQPTGNGRRQSYAHPPMPRMTNTYMLPGKSSARDVISSVKRGVYAVSFGGGQVDITSGKFVFSSSESYLIEDGKITKPIKGATFIGDGSQILKQISAIANDLELDPGIGTCGKDGQNIPVGVGQPTIKVDSITVGGTG